MNKNKTVEVEEKDLIMVDENDKPVNNTSVAIVADTDDGYNMMLDLTTPREQSYCSVNIENLTEDEEVDFFNAINSTEKHVGDCINQILEVKHVYCEMVTLTDQDTGEQSVAPRTVLIDKDGIGYGTCSKGVFGSLAKLFSMSGQPDTWKEPKKLLVKQVVSGKNKILTLQRAK